VSAAPHLSCRRAEPGRGRGVLGSGEKERYDVPLGAKGGAAEA